MFKELVYVLGRGNILVGDNRYLNVLLKYEIRDIVIYQGIKYKIKAIEYSRNLLDNSIINIAFNVSEVS